MPQLSFSSVLPPLCWPPLAEQFDRYPFSLRQTFDRFGAYSRWKLRGADGRIRLLIRTDSRCPQLSCG